ncbi:MAG: response regulator [Micavibrio aeruginosavorus]|uniref:Response regulator n=1 Tax=Micavibrio aeruginosavorus TaxID=349221 RepID=A0A7T5UH21_9BACT|nr:MAG: response regulator [Micavibrio aeruginosavorus]
MSKTVQAIQTASVGNKQKRAYSLGAFRILIVEDYPFMADLMSTMLREFGVGNIIQASSGTEGKEMISLFNSDENARNKIDIVLLDWLMPEGDGLDLLRWIRGHKKDSIKFLPSVLCSAYTSEAVVSAGRDNGANEVLVKPVSAQKLASRLLYVIDKPRPFLRAPGFFGPDRRRKSDSYSGVERRITKPEDVKQFNERI